MEMCPICKTIEQNYCVAHLKLQETLVIGQIDFKKSINQIKNALKIMTTSLKIETNHP